MCANEFKFVQSRKKLGKIYCGILLGWERRECDVVMLKTQKIFLISGNEAEKEKHLNKISRTCHVIASLMLETSWNAGEKARRNRRAVRQFITIVKFTDSEIDITNGVQVVSLESRQT